jgi:5-methylcytosine-specific restriction protein A
MLKPRPARRASNWSKRKSRHERGYGRAHELMRERVLREEPLCRMCLAMDPPRYTPATIADHIVPRAEGGTDERENYQGLDAECHKAKTAKEAARARRRAGRHHGYSGNQPRT